MNCIPTPTSSARAIGRMRRLQRAGHADLVETQNGETYMVYLCGRPLKNRGRCTLGRETAIQKMAVARMAGFAREGEPGMPQLETPAPKLPPTPSRPRRSATISTRPICRSISNGCARPSRTTFSA